MVDWLFVFICAAHQMDEAARTDSTTTSRKTPATVCLKADHSL
jgi:hypothetical protein